MYPWEKWTDAQWQASNELIRRGSIRHLLTKPQREFYDMYKQNVNQETGLYSCRKLGKSTASLLFAYEHCLASSGRIVRFVLPHLKQAREVIFPIVAELIPVMPPDVAPRLLKSESAILFPNGSQIRLGGASKENCEGNRGPRADLLILDEIASFDMENYFYVLNSILFPQLTISQGPILYLTTPPKTPNHPFIQHTYPKLLSTNSLKVFTIYDNPLISDRQRDKIIELYGGVDSPDFKREYLSELIPDNNLRLTPEWVTTDANTFTVPPERVDHFGKREVYTGYVSMDVGLQDNTACLFAYLDHNTQKVVVVDEFVGNYKTMAELTKMWTEGVARNLTEFCPFVEGIVDVFPITAYSLKHDHGLDFRAPKSKGKVEDQISFLRNAIENEKVLISKTCKRLLWELETAIWDDKRKGIARDDKQSHGDCVMALTYLIKSVDFRRRPGQNGNVNLGKIGSTRWKK